MTPQRILRQLIFANLWIQDISRQLIFANFCEQINVYFAMPQVIFAGTNFREYLNFGYFAATNFREFCQFAKITCREN